MSHATTHDGVKLYYEEAGSGKPLIFVHEFGGDHRSWEPQMRFFSRYYRCIAFNARGYPPSEVPQDPEKCGKAPGAAVLDLFSRRVVGWSMQSSMTAQLVTDALLMALWRRGKPKELLHHSDQGSQYTSEEFQRLLAEHSITCSMSRQGNVWDNSAMESFFSTLKTERVHRRQYRSRDEARADVFDYIERFYNPRRRHSSIGFVSPVEFENSAGSA